MISNPIFIIGTERSGSNLLRLLLNAHPNIAIPHPPHVMRDMAPIEPFYGSARFELMAEDMARAVNMHFAPWPFQISAKELVAISPSRTLYGLYAALYEKYRAHSGKARWGCKSTFMFAHIGEILAHHSAPRFLHLVRDPRDVAASAGDSIFSQYHPFKQAALWTDQQIEIEKWAPKLKEKYLRVRYEDLTARPEEETRRIMEFLTETFSPDQLQFFNGPEARGLAALSESWKNCAAPVSRSSVGRYKNKLSPREIELTEFQTFDLMKSYGYAPESQARPQAPTSAELLWIESQDRWRMLGTEGRALIRDRNFGLRWKKWMYLQGVRALRSLTHA